MKTRMEHGSMGEIAVEEDKYWGAQTQCSYRNFKIGDGKILLSVICAFAHLKLACVEVNYELGRTGERKLDAIATTCDEILYNGLDAHLPLPVWQTGSETQNNMNVNEVIANHGNEIAGEQLLHPNDDANKGQSSNDTLPAAMYIAVIEALHRQLTPQLEETIHALKRLERENQHIIKIGRTRLQNATPLRSSQEISG